MAPIKTCMYEFWKLNIGWFIFLILNVMLFMKHHMESIPDTWWCLLFKCYCALLKRWGYYCHSAISSDIFHSLPNNSSYYLFDGCNVLPLYFQDIVHNNSKYFLSNGREILFQNPAGHMDNYSYFSSVQHFELINNEFHLPFHFTLPVSWDLF